MKKFALIVAGGVGARMGAEVPKQFILLAGKPILFWTIQRFLDFDPGIELTLVLPENQFERWHALCREYAFTPDVQLVKGGQTRFQSVKNGLDAINEEGIVFIHDGVRPLVSHQTLSNCFQLAVEKGNALPVAPVVESLRQVTEDSSRHVDRSQFRLVQTPQTFQTSIIQLAYQQPEQAFFTDDASVCEAAGISIHLVDGNPENIKITTPVDLLLAETLLNKLP
ncbi:2-C-methyl-D-erythritol 4-phosphate cytidylyltransferase [uncultured Sunxiuqinia sp.]|uniref:2-C-methyl-D-erythritol 4-phosphate cytidylyltransferase n=1 Tax=uncultured Sunxiuqinia sp. TaxID=1573825 RepID=UPI00260A7EA1|nr:2-C-methyl-D-erythritol 4-phosphate cytidylyltransferase [uncultured Sunxiuqinia sp.]